MVEPAEFEEIVEEALRTLPKRFADLLDNVAVIVEEEPTDDDLEALEEDGELLGIYRGTPLTHRHYDALPLMPDRIAIFRGPILRVTHGRRAAALRQIRDTVIHELGHYFGLSDDDMAY